VLQTLRQTPKLCIEPTTAPNTIASARSMGHYVVQLYVQPKGLERGGVADRMFSPFVLLRFAVCRTTV
jgi:hypothetical protein